jgi:hypothetical protein
MFFGNIGSLVSTWAFQSWDGPEYHIGNGLNFATSSTMMIIATGTLVWMRWDNKKRDNRTVDAELAGHNRRLKNWNGGTLGSDGYLKWLY